MDTSSMVVDDLEMTVRRPVKSTNQCLRERIDVAREQHGMSPSPNLKPEE
jgi:hypothetical protein